MALTLITNGLVFRDQFNRPDSTTVGNNWIEVEAVATDARILSNALRLRSPTVPTFTDVLQTALTHPSDYIAQYNFVNVLDSSHNLVQRGALLASPGSESGYTTAPNEALNTSRLIRLDAGVGTVIASAAWVEVLGQFWSNRLVGSVEATGVRNKIYLYQITSLSDLSATPVLSVNFLDLNVDVPPGLSNELRLRETGGNNILTDFDEYFLCGRNVQIIGVPTGWKGSVDGGGKVTEIGGIITIDVDGISLPAGQVDLFNDLDGLEDTFLGELWGGAQFAGGVPLPPSNLKCTCRVDRLAIDLVWQDNSIDELGFRIERKKQGEPDTSYVTVGSVPFGVEAFTDIGLIVPLIPAQCFTYRIIAEGIGDSNPSNEASCKTRQWSECLAAVNCEPCEVGTGPGWDEGYDGGFG